MPTNRRSRIAIPLLAVALVVGLAAASNAMTAPPADRQVSKAGNDYLNRVVIARMYQRGSWVIPAADTYPGSYRPDVYPPEWDRRIAYVCDSLAYLRPRYVSGLVRIDYKDDIGQAKKAERKAIFGGVRQCLREKTGRSVKFDVVLNALHYTDEKYGVQTTEQGKQRLMRTLRKAQNAFHPDGWYFDFYTSPWKPGSGRHPKAMSKGLRWIRGADDKPKQFVGGTVWGTKAPVPDRTSFISITDRGGMDYVRKLAAHFTAKGVPLTMHIDNDPQNPNSQGSRWYNGTRDRQAVLKRHVNGQRLGYDYMYPTFFPLGTPAGPAFDIAQHPKLFERMCEYIREKCGSLSAGRPVGTDLTGVHRGHNDGSGQYLYSGSRDEIRNAPGVRMEKRNAFYLATTPVYGTVPFHRCYLGSGWHLLTAAGPGCEGAAGATDEGSLGYIAQTQLPGTRPLYRLYNSALPDHYYVTNPNKRDAAIRNGYTYEGISGYVWKQS